MRGAGDRGAEVQRTGRGLRSAAGQHHEREEANGMVQGKPSRTALGVALHRAAHQLVDQPPLAFADPLAVTIFGADGEGVVRRWLARPRAGAGYMRAQMVARSRFVEDALREGVSAGVRQYVLLGAGLDTFGHRNPYEAAGLRVFEVDHPATQVWKRAMFAGAGLTPPESLTFVPLNFERERLADGLARAGLRFEEAALFAWLGVVPYLTLDAIDATLRFIAGRAPGTGVIFDYGESPETLHPAWRGAYEAAAARVASAGEPWITFFDPADLARRLHALGFAETRDLDADAINRRYFEGRGDGLRLPRHAHLMQATVGADESRR